VILTARRFLIPLTFAAIAMLSVEAAAQGAFPAPLPNQSGAAASPFPPVNGAAAAPASASPFPPASSAAAPSSFPAQGAAPLGGGMAGGAFGGGGVGAPGGGGGGSAEQEQCMRQFGPLREEAQRRAGLIKAASERKAPAQEACKLITSFVQAESKLVSFVTSKQSACGIPAEIPKQMKSGHARTLELRKSVCAAATAQQQGGGPAAPPSLSEVLGSSSPVETRSATRGGGSTFDTINGNVLAR
jgi:hypothetical protein